MRSYRNASSSASPTSAGTWALIVTAICACCAAVATSRRPWERTAGYRDMSDPRYAAAAGVLHGGRHWRGLLLTDLVPILPSAVDRNQHVPARNPRRGL